MQHKSSADRGRLEITTTQRSCVGYRTRGRSPLAGLRCPGQLAVAHRFRQGRLALLLTALLQFVHVPPNLYPGAVFPVELGHRYSSLTSSCVTPPRLTLHPVCVGFTPTPPHCTPRPTTTVPPQDWLNHWPRDQLLFLRNEDYSAATREHMEGVVKFLDMREPTPEQWDNVRGKEGMGDAGAGEGRGGQGRGVVVEDLVQVGGHCWVLRAGGGAALQCEGVRLLLHMLEARNMCSSALGPRNGSWEVHL